MTVQQKWMLAREGLFIMALYFGWRAIRGYRLLLFLLFVAWMVYSSGCSASPPKPIEQPPIVQPTPEAEPALSPMPAPKPTPDPWATYLKYGPESRINTSLLHAVDVELPEGETITDAYCSNNEQYAVVPIKAHSAHVVIAQKVPDALAAELYIYTDSEHVYRLMLHPHNNRRDYARVLRFQ